MIKFFFNNQTHQLNQSSSSAFLSDNFCNVVSCGLTDVMKGITRNSEPEALAIVGNLSRASRLKTIDLWEVSFDYNRTNFRAILARDHPGITVTFH